MDGEWQYQRVLQGALANESVQACMVTVYRRLSTTILIPPDSSRKSAMAWRIYTAREWFTQI